MQGEVIVGLDIGTTKICSVVGEVATGKTNIIGIGTNPSIGLRKGVVVNIESTVESIKKAVEEAELMAGCEISSVYAGIAGGHITGFNSRGIVAIKGSEIVENDVERVIDAARAVAIPMDREVIHVLPQEYIVDDEAGIQNPVGMAGVRLEAKIHIVTGAVASAHNIVKCCNRSGLDVCDIVLESLASGEAVLTSEESRSVRMTLEDGKVVLTSRAVDIGEARVRLEEPDAESGVFTGPVRPLAMDEPAKTRFLPWALLAVALAALGWFAFGRPGSGGADPPTARGGVAGDLASRTSPKSSVGVSFPPLRAATSSAIAKPWVVSVATTSEVRASNGRTE